MTYDLRVLPRAEQDLLELASWIAERSPAGAATWLSTYERLLLRIQEAPLSFERAQEAEKLNRDIRQAMFRTRHGNRYRVVFIVAESTVYILRIRGFGQPPLSEFDV